MSARSRAAPWFGGKHLRTVLDGPAYQPIPPASGFGYEVRWAPGEREKAAAAGYALGEAAFIEATQKLIDRAMAQRRWWEEIDPVGVVAFLGSAGGA